MGRGLQAMEFHLQMLRRVTTDTMGNSVLRDDVALEALVPITRNLTEPQLRQCAINAIRNAAYRYWMRAPHPESLHEAVILVTMGDFVLARAELNA
ncbi:unnamed protein product [Sphagnum compactum]